MAKHYRVASKEGLQAVVAPENSDLKLLKLSVLQSGCLQSYQGKTGAEETVFVLTAGALKFCAGGKLLGTLARKSVFEEPPWAVYLPPETEYSLEFEKESEACLVSSPARKTKAPVLIAPKDLKFRRVGEETYFRNITDIITEGFPAEKMLVGETINDPGNWSSYPPHKHDRNNPPEEVQLEEVYFFKVTPVTGFGTIRVFDEKEDQLFLLRNNEVVTIPKGYHPVAVAPKHQIYYFWALAGSTRTMKPYTHPDYRF